MWTMGLRVAVESVFAPFQSKEAEAWPQRRRGVGVRERDALSHCVAQNVLSGSGVEPRMRRKVRTEAFAATSPAVTTSPLRSSPPEVMATWTGDGLVRKDAVRAVVSVTETPTRLPSTGARG
jgi:hypothetical protein